MLIFYADEYGDHSMLTKSGAPLELKKGTSDFFVLTGVGVRDTSRKPLAESLVALKRKHFGRGASSPVWGDTEIKGRHLFRAARSVASGNVLQSPTGYQDLDTPWKVNALVKDLGLIFSTYRPLVFAVVVDKREMLSRKKDLHPIGVAYAYMHQRIATAMADLYAGDASIIVADQQTQHEAFFRTGKMNEIRKQLTKGLTRKPNYDLVLDKPLWVDTELSSWDREIIQLADIVAYSVATCMQRGEAPDEACYLWSQIEKSMHVHWQTGKLLGGGLSIFPTTAKAPKV